MRIVNLIEDTIGNPSCVTEHGLSFYIETKKHKLLVDTGASDAFITNARNLSIDLGTVDTVILSHGHYDHGGGLLFFRERNKTATIYIRETAFLPYFHVSGQSERYIGLDEKISKMQGLKPVSGSLEIDEELYLFGDVIGRKLFPTGNLELKCRKKTEFVQDDFLHEQYLVIKADGKEILISGCAHNGILNILERYKKIFGKEPDVVISGFHMMKKSGYSKQDIEVIKETAGELAKMKTSFYTGHCTGEKPYEIMKEIMGEKLTFIHCGEEIRGI